MTFLDLVTKYKKQGKSSAEATRLALEDARQARLEEEKKAAKIEKKRKQKEDKERKKQREPKPPKRPFPEEFGGIEDRPKMRIVKRRGRLQSR